ncbi:VOC family protein [Sphingomonas sp. SFZ2018-12]|uniref:VOC family protein n=1 Tax=Sphingomonas sp. SFZ2018-12 TaxID=2683197 RepID=UPI00082BCE3E|nr:VOC family protein [Sphingomonas sp. SFZ2018-12]MCH4891768.1 VOC family protein [Sphingomonas sp. SFZ2018-12]
MIGYVTLGVNDLDRARAFYDGLLGVIGAKRLMQMEENGFTMYGTDWKMPGIAITKPYDGNAARAGNGNMVALIMDSRDKVDALHAKALELGGTCDGPPGLRAPEEMGFYAAYFRDPEGNKIAAFNAPMPG